MQNNMSNESSDIEVIEAVKKSDIPEPKKEEVIATMEMYNGPIPHPDILAGFDKLDKGAAKKIIDNGIAESLHRRKMENRLLNRENSMYTINRTLGFILAIVIIGGGFYLILNNHPIIGSIFSSTFSIAVLGLFLGNNNSSNDNK
ncbi:DUF2335 domain-containing protein [Staphylococcus kloosii]|uniref:DUF2335 domain-containing protein n=1 Tax=Staphylococcus kloosii TaxID=29384 RepID=A0A151A5X6_9STAP|nr:DUF2335 domain-containing protein [Staphylococcus kloosii]KYH14756.1 hypothetical protein A0131_08195 [Staphylococcus kloosii]